MRNNLPFKLLLATALLVGSVHADVMYTIPAGTTVGGDAVSGTVDFFLSGATCGHGGACALNIELSNTESGTEAVAQAISGITFTLSNVTTTLTLSSTVGSSDLHSENQGTISGNVTTITYNGSTSTTTSKGNWAVESNPTGTDWGTGNYALTSVTGKNAKDMIVDGSGGGNIAFFSDSPSYEGPVYFQISNSSITTSTEISDLAILFGSSSSATSPLGDFAFPSTGDCTAAGDGSCNGGLIGLSTPEPTSFLLTGAGLLGLLCLLRRYRAA